MIRICNDVKSVKELTEHYNHIVLYGAGASCRLFLKSFWADCLQEKVICIVDNNQKLNGTYIEIGNCTIKIISLKDFLNKYSALLTDIVFLLTPIASSVIVPELDKVQMLDGIKTYLLPMISSNVFDAFSLKNDSVRRIPKKIHYIWIGGKSLPEEYKKNILSWQKYCPDYEIICWNENNYDFEKNQYMKEAYSMGGNCLMYATDYARKDILFNCGGIYLDTDVELIKPLDELLYNRAFIGIEGNGQVNSGSALGAEKGHPMIKKMMERYENESFLDVEGNLTNKYNTYFETDCLIDYGYKMINKLQVINGMTCFPQEVFMPINYAGMENCFTDKTVSVHKINPEDCAWHRELYEQWKHRIIL